MAASFDVTSQDAGTINNVGGDQHLHVSQARRRLAAMGKGLTLLALCLSIAGLVTLGFAGYGTFEDVRTAVDDGSFGTPYLDYAPAYWPFALGCFVGGIVLGKLGRALSL
jgi:hypothetical protein